MPLLDDVPEDIEVLRLRFFEAREPHELSGVDWARLWPFVDNFWSTWKSTKSDGLAAVIYRCRLHRGTERTAAAIQEQDGGRRKRQKPSHNPIGCGMKLKVVTAGDHVRVERHGECPEHCHTLDEADSYKRNSALRDMAAQQVAEGFKPSEVFNNLRGSAHTPKRRKFQAAGGKFLKLGDIHNAGEAWIKQNPGLRRFDANAVAARQVASASKWLREHNWCSRQLQVSFYSFFYAFY
jgi:hypothetical protein